MGHATQSVGQPEAPLSDLLITDLRYHKNQNVRLTLVALPVYLVLIVLYYARGNFLQVGIFTALWVNAIVALLMWLRVKDLNKLNLFKGVLATITFVLVAASIMAGLCSEDLYISYPWVFLYPVTVTLFLGRRTGMAWAAVFCVAMGFLVWSLELPAWNEEFIATFKFHTILCLIFLLLVGVISESSRVRMRNHLLEARNKHKAAEEQQRQTNAELKNEIDMRLESEKALTQSETRYRALFEESAVSLWEENWSGVKARLDELPIHADGDLEACLKEHPEEIGHLAHSIRVMAVNRATLALCEAESMAVLLKNIRTLLPPEAKAFMTQRITAIRRNGRYDGQVTVQTLNGHRLHLLVGSAIPAGYEKSWEKVYTTVYNITERVAVEEERKRVDQQMQHTRQIQAVSSLAGGIAHQFNNALAIICGNLDLLALDPQGPGPNNRFMDALRGSTDRMRGLTEQLLAYARGGKYQPRDFSINDLIRDLLKTSKLSRNPSIRFAARFEEDVHLIGGDTTQIRMVVEAVLANAVEAMANGGEVLVTTRNIELQASPKGTDGVLAPGRYGLITIADQGIGMDAETLRCVFEPFFTTKFMGRGLGMAAAHGIVRNHDGMIEIKSEPNKGTQVLIYLPGTEASAAQPMSAPTRKAA